MERLLVSYKNNDYTFLKGFFLVNFRETVIFERSLLTQKIERFIITEHSHARATTAHTKQSAQFSVSEENVQK